jgi:hypothetical protein
VPTRKCALNRISRCVRGKPDQVQSDRVNLCRLGRLREYCTGGGGAVPHAGGEFGRSADFGQAPVWASASDLRESAIDAEFNAGGHQPVERPATSGFGTFETRRPSLDMSGYRGRPEVIGVRSR